jgi:hypothetical protein
MLSRSAFAIAAARPKLDRRAENDPIASSERAIAHGACDAEAPEYVPQAPPVAKKGRRMPPTNNPYGDPMQGRTVGHDPADDLTQGREVGEHTFDDPTHGTGLEPTPDEDTSHGREVSEAPYDDPAQGREVGSGRYEDPTKSR